MIPFRAALPLFFFLGACYSQNSHSSESKKKDVSIPLSRDVYLQSLKKKFAGLDKDGSGKIDSHECSKIAAWCRKADQNHDGLVDLNEFNHQTERDFQAVDRNKNQFLENEEKDGLVLFRF